jgi:YidC/Oxa1 family membrane protein insertase
MWNTVFIQPIFNSLILIYNLIGDMGLAIIFLTILIQLLLIPLYNRQLKSQQAMKDLQPKLKEIQKKHAKDKQKQSQAMMELYQSEGVNPLSGCLPLLIQFPIFIAVYYVFRSYLTEDSFKLLYSFVGRPETLNTSFLGWCDLAQPDKIILPLLAGVTSYFQIQSMPQPDLVPQGDQKKGQDQGFGGQLSRVFSSQMKGFMPIMSFVIVMQLPAAIGVYWITRNIFTIIQQKILLKDQAKNGNGKVKVKVEKA